MTPGGLPGLGKAVDNRLTFPSHWTSAQALNSGEWVRFATEVEKAGEAEECKKWWRPLGWTPTSILHSGRGGIALPDEPMGMYGATVTVLAQEPVHNLVEPTREASPNVNLAEIPTPSTPRSRSSCSARRRLLQELDVQSLASPTRSSSSSAMEEDEEEGNVCTQPAAITASAGAELDARAVASVPRLNHATEPWGRLSGVVFLGDVFQLPPFPSATEDSSGISLDTASYEEGSTRSTVLSDGGHAEDAPMPALIEVFGALGAAEEARLQG